MLEPDSVAQSVKHQLHCVGGPGFKTGPSQTKDLKKIGTCCYRPGAWHYEDRRRTG